ncbi:MAG TPA: TetR/AcrR family transcriptional regulator [Thermoanaerobaculia bacterium]|nr:TetR/AcrR family transcriptional regulator [Thermoanaerobaculia bacterium]
MRYDAEHKQRTRERLLKVAAKAVRAEGPERVGVAAVMRRAGLTHGGFYAHFASKDAMVVAAIGQMFEESHDRWMAATANRSPEDGLVLFVDSYLSAAHRDARASGCPIAALLADLPRLSSACKRAVANGTRRLTAMLAAQLERMHFADAEDLAGSVIAELVGAVSLARGEPDRARSENILAASRRLLKERLGLEERS